MTRDEVIIQTSEERTYQKPPQYSELVHKSRKVMCAYQVGFIDGAVWADEHPADKTIKRIVALYKEWYTTESNMGIVEYVKQHWEDK